MTVNIFHDFRDRFVGEVGSVRLGHAARGKCHLGQHVGI